VGIIESGRGCQDFITGGSWIAGDIMVVYEAVADAMMKVTEFASWMRTRESAASERPPHSALAGRSENAGLCLQRSQSANWIPWAFPAAIHHQFAGCGGDVVQVGALELRAE